MGKSLVDTITLAKKVKDAREYLGLSQEDVAAMLGLPLSEIEYLEQFSIVEGTNEKSKTES